MKITTHSKYLLSLIAGFLLSFQVCAKTTVKASLDSATMLMGTVRTLKVVVDQNQQSPSGHFPMFKNISEKGYVGVCGDSVELRAPVKADTIISNNNLTIKFDIPVQSFDSGYYKIPSIEFVSGVDTARSNEVMLRVYPVSGVTAETPIDDYAGVASPEGKSIFDSVPDWLYYYWWIVLIVVGIACAGVYLWSRYKREGSILPQKPEPTPYERAITGLRNLKEKKLWENGMEKEYFTELTDILRDYLYRRFDINAVEMTSRQILASLSSNPDTKDRRAMIRQILEMADFVKFAKIRPLPEDNIRAYENAVKFVEETKAKPEIEEIPEEKGGKK